MPKKIGERMILKQFFIKPSLFNRLHLFAVNHGVSVSKVIRCSVERFINGSISGPVLQKTLWTDPNGHFCQGMPVDHRASDVVQIERREKKVAI